MAEAREALEARVEALGRWLHDPRRARECGASLEQIARGKRYRLLGHATFDDFVRSLGISRPTAHRLRTLARAPASLDIPPRGRTAAYEAARALTRGSVTPPEATSAASAPAKKAAVKKAAVKKAVVKNAQRPARPRPRKRSI